MGIQRDGSSIVFVADTGALLLTGGAITFLSHIDQRFALVVDLAEPKFFAGRTDQFPIFWSKF